MDEAAYDPKSLKKIIFVLANFQKDQYPLRKKALETFKGLYQHEKVLNPECITLPF